MDSLRQYSAPWGYQLLERMSPRGRGYSLGVRPPAAWVPAGLGGLGACWPACPPSAWVPAGCLSDSLLPGCLFADPASLVPAY